MTSRGQTRRSQKKGKNIPDYTESCTCGIKCDEEVGEPVHWVPGQEDPQQLLSDCTRAQPQEGLKTERGSNPDKVCEQAAADTVLDEATLSATSLVRLA